MLYCYLSDTALTPLLTNDEGNLDQAITNYNELMGLGGVGQVNERILNMFNTEYSIEISQQPEGSKAQKYPNLVIDPRIAANTAASEIAYRTDRLLGTFSGNIGTVSGTSTMRAVGNMRLHYDAYLAAKDANPSGTGGDKGNLIASLANTSENNRQFAQLFNVIEAIVYTHIYNETNNVWIYSNANDLNNILAADVTKYGNGTTTTSDASAGYVYGSLSLSTVDIANDKRATVRNRDTSDVSGTVKTTIGNNSTLRSYTAPVLFPNLIKFSFRFSALEAPTLFCIYLNPDTFFSEYNKVTITHIICPTKPADLVDLAYYTQELTLNKSSDYVANLLTGEITPNNQVYIKNSGSTYHLTTDTTFKANQTYYLYSNGVFTRDTAIVIGATIPANTYYVCETPYSNGGNAAKFVTRYIPPYDDVSSRGLDSEYQFTFTCIYKGRTPTTAEMRTAIRELLETANGGESVEDIFPDLYITTSYILIPMYETRVVADTNLNVTYCENIFSLDQLLKNYNGINSASVRSEVPEKVIDNASLLNVPAYYMHVLVYPEDYTGTPSSPTPVYRLDQISKFTSYQPIASTDKYWITLSEEARALNQMLTKLIASQLYNYATTDVAYTVETKAIFGEDKKRTYLTFTIGGYSFSMMTRESYISSAN